MHNYWKRINFNYLELRNRKEGLESGFRTVPLSASRSGPIELRIWVAFKKDKRIYLSAGIICTSILEVIIQGYGACINMLICLILF